MAQFFIGDIVKTRKPHPCGSDEWEVTRIGMDFRIKCLKCGHSVMLPRVRFEKSVKAILKRGPEYESTAPGPQPTER